MSVSTRNRAASIGSERSGANRAAQDHDYKNSMPLSQSLRYFDPCAATASMFLYAQGSSVVVCHHDTLTIERRFSRHQEEVRLLAVDTQSEQGAGRLVMSYDVGQTAIVWDLMTGDEIARFASYDPLTSAAWMRNGSVAFGNSQGSIIQFEPGTSEHISSRTLDQIAVTSLAPSADCRTFAIGYQNGNVLVATLQPRFTVLHNLTTSRAPSPIVTIQWHASSARSRADMLAVQMHDGDLRIWSVAKSHKVDDPAKVVRILKKSDNVIAGANWMGWSKNGRVIQFSDSETLSWDVRTKHVTSDSIPTLEHVKGIAVYGPGASLFTLGPNGTVQQFDLNSPAIMVANHQHPANLLPPSPPNSIEEPGDGANSTTTIHTSDSESSIPIEMGVSESDEDHMSPYARIRRGTKGHKKSGRERHYETASEVSSRSRQSLSSAGSRTPGRYPASLRSRGLTENTYISGGTSMRSSTVGKQEQRDLDTYSMGYSVGSTSIASSRHSKRRPSRLRNEVARSPDEGSSKVHELFKYTRSRLSDIPYKHPVMPENGRMTNDDLRRQMMSTIFGWHSEVEDLIRDEMSRHPSGSPSRMLLAKWLGDVETDILAASSENMTSSDWMLLALSGIGGPASQHKLGRTFVQRLLESGDVHVAVTIMLGMGDQNDAIEVYVSHKRYMEALILTCLVFPSVWERQVAIIKKWGEWAIEHGQQELAIRCFSCTGQESSEPWASPSAAQLTFQSMNPSIPEVLSPPLSPPGLQRGPQRSIAKTSTLRLITSFGEQSQKSKFFDQFDGGQTPLAAGVTPIAIEQDPTTAFIRPSNGSLFNTPTSSRPSYSRGRLPSIGESNHDDVRRALQKHGLSTDESEASETSRVSRVSRASRTSRTSRTSHQRDYSHDRDNMSVGSSLARAATASPNMTRDRAQRKMSSARQSDDEPPAPDQRVLAKMEQARMNKRNGSRDRIPLGVNLQLRSLEQPSIAENGSADQHQGASSARYHWPSRRRGPSSVASSVTSVSSAGRGKSLRNNDYISSLDTASQYSRRNRSRHASKERARDTSRSRHTSRERGAKSREPSEDRGRGQSRTWTQAKRSPTSPVPMSPEDIANLGTPRGYSETGEPLTIKTASGANAASRASSRSRRKSPDGRPRPPALDIRGRSASRGVGAHLRSPSSPLPLTATTPHYQGSEDEEDYQRAMQEREIFRAKHSRSRGLASPATSKKDDGEAGDILQPLAFRSRAMSTEHAGDLRAMKDERQRKKELAARELEERRRSLAKRPSAPSIPHPDQFSPGFPRVGVEAADEKLPDHVPTRSKTEPPRESHRGMHANRPHVGLPATPKAMRLIMETDNGSDTRDLPNVPPIPATFAQRHSPKLPPSRSSERKSDPEDFAVSPTTVEAPARPKPKAEAEASAEPLTLLLPSTVYTPPPRPMIPRSASAPIPDEPGAGRWARKGSVPEVQGLPGIDEVVSSPRRRSQEDKSLPPPPPPAPQQPAPLVRELQHLAYPPPPPPAPLPHLRSRYNVSGASNGAIEVVMDTDDEPEPVVAAPNDHMVPVLPLPAPRSKGHSRGREGSVSMSGASDRLRSASRGHRDMQRKGSLPDEMPYSSRDMRAPTGGPPPVTFDRDAIRSPPLDRRGKHMSNMSTGLERGEMI